MVIRYNKAPAMQIPHEMNRSLRFMMLLFTSAKVKEKTTTYISNLEEMYFNRNKKFVHLQKNIRYD